MRRELEELRAKFDALSRQVFGKKSEKTTPVAREVRKERPRTADETRAERRRRAEARGERVETVEEQLPVPPEQRHCPKCSGTKLKNLGDGKPTTMLEWVSGHFRKRTIRREVLVCACGGIVNAPTPEKTTDGTRYAPSFIAHLMVQKCACHMPFYRLEKHYNATGIPLARSTMNELLHRNATLLTPLVSRLLARIAAEPVVHADETPMKCQSQKKKGYMWTFLGGNLVAYVYSPSRSGTTPLKILGASSGTLVVDAYSGYNQVTTPSGRIRAGCLAHARRKIFDAKDAGKEAEEGISLIRELYLIEEDTKDIASVSERMTIRQERGRPIFARLLMWARSLRRVHGPRGAMGKAVGYLLRNRKAISRFLHDAAVPLDNNPAERELRRVALGRKNYLFFGDAECGENIAGVYSLIATCERHRVDPQAYLQDVLLRVQSHPDSQLDELLPDRWRPPDTPRPE